VVSGPLPNLPRPGDTIDRYRVVSQIARGGMAVVYAVQRSSLGGFEKLLAMKVMLPHLAGEQRFVDMFLDEARIASQIRHANVVEVFDVGQHEGAPFILMELVRGPSLSALVQRARQAAEAPPPAFWLDVLAQAALGLHAAHETNGSDGAPLGIVHRDVSPQNILVDYDGRAKMADFGIAAARGRLAGTRTGEIKGKFAYCAPEQLTRDRPLSRTVDVWALGVVGWELFAGRKLFKAEDEASCLWSVMNQRVPPLQTFARDLPDTAASALMACLERDSYRRTSTAKEVAEALSSAAAELSGGRPTDVVGWLERLHGAERRTQEAHFAAALSGGVEAGSLPVNEAVGQPGTPQDAKDDTQLSAAGPRTPGPRKNTRFVAGIFIAAAVGAGWFALARGRQSPVVAAATDSSQQASAATTQVTSPSVSPAPEAPRLQVAVDPQVRLVLVDGTRHDERPLEIQLGTTGVAVVELVATDGRIERREVRREDDGASLELPAAPAPGGGARPAPRPTSSPLLRNPF
jgi:eukaryotic-like serine/threonine-protein kinase